MLIFHNNIADEILAFIWFLLHNRFYTSYYSSRQYIYGNLKLIVGELFPF